MKIKLLSIINKRWEDIFQFANISISMFEIYKYNIYDIYGIIYLKYYEIKVINVFLVIFIR